MIKCGNDHRILIIIFDVPGARVLPQDSKSAAERILIEEFIHLATRASDPTVWQKLNSGCHDECGGWCPPLTTVCVQGKC